MAGNYELTALSGIQAASNGLSVVSNNIANSQTQGFKQSNIQFADLFTGSQNSPGSGVRTAAVVTDYSQGTISGTNNDLDLAVNGLGMFVLGDPSERFDQVYTRNGAFKLDSDGYIVSHEGYPLLGYTKNEGQSTEYSPVFNTTLEKLNIGDLNKKPKATTEMNLDINLNSSRPDNMDAVGNGLRYASFDTTTLALTFPDTQNETNATDNAGNLLATDGNPDNDADGDGLSNTTKTDIANALRFGKYTGSPDFSTNKTVYDTLGGEHRVSFDFYKIRTNGSPGTETQTTDWQVHMEIQDYNENTGSWERSGRSLIPDDWNGITADTDNNGVPDNWLAYNAASFDPTDATTNPPSIDYTVRFDSKGSIIGVATNAVDAQSPNTDFFTTIQPVAFALDNPLSGANDPLGSDLKETPALASINVDFAAMTQYAGQFTVRGISQDGYSIGDLVGVSIAGDGTIEARYTNGRADPVARIPLATFDDVHSLFQMGGQMYAETYASGPFILGEAQGSGFGSILSGSLEFSNVDVTNELVRMISLQRTYQASAQVISTSQQLNQTILQL